MRKAYFYVAERDYIRPDGTGGKVRSSGVVSTAMANTDQAFFSCITMRLAGGMDPSLPEGAKWTEDPQFLTFNSL